MKVFLAGTFHDPLFRELIPSLPTFVTNAGFEVVSRWHSPEVWIPESKQTSLEERQRIARYTYEDLERADALVLVGYEPHTLRGSHVEIGYALGRKKPCVYYGVPNHVDMMVFHPSVRTVKNTTELVKVLGEIDRTAAKSGVFPY